MIYYLEAVYCRYAVNAEYIQAFVNSLGFESIDATWEERHALRKARVYTYVWSPIGLPRGVEVHLSYHLRARHWTSEFQFLVAFRFVPDTRRQTSRR